MYIFPHAGGSPASFLPWQELLAPAIELAAIHLPGRGARFHEPNAQSIQEIVAPLAQELARQPLLPFAFFGHSLGALVAFELTRYLHANGAQLPLHLFVSGCHAPRYRNPSRQLHRMDDHTLLEELRTYNGTPAELLQSRELMEIVLPIIRADFGLAERFAYQPAPKLDVPMSILAGRGDDYETPEQSEGWQEETDGPCALHWFDGDHFFIHSECQRVLSHVNQTMATCLACL